MEIIQRINNISEIPFLSKVLVLGFVGVGRNILEVLIGGKWARAWFSLSPDLFFTMFFYPIFLCFFGSMVLHFFSRLFGLKVKMKIILPVLFLLQLAHLFIPFFDGLAAKYSLPFRFSFVAPSLYAKLIFSPLAFTPLILLFTWPTSLGIDIAWLLASIVLLRLYIKKLKLPSFKSLLALCISFYVVYMSVYPVYLFFLNEVIRGSNYMFGFFFLVMSIPSIIYVRKMEERGA